MTSDLQLRDDVPHSLPPSSKCKTIRREWGSEHENDQTDEKHRKHGRDVLKHTNWGANQ